MCYKRIVYIVQVSSMSFGIFGLEDGGSVMPLLCSFDIELSSIKSSQPSKQLIAIFAKYLQPDHKVLF